MEFYRLYICNMCSLNISKANTTMNKQLFMFFFWFDKKISYFALLTILLFGFWITGGCVLWARVWPRFLQWLLGDVIWFLNKDGTSCLVLSPIFSMNHWSNYPISLHFIDFMTNFLYLLLTTENFMLKGNITFDCGDQAARTPTTLPESWWRSK